MDAGAKGSERQAAQWSLRKRLVSLLIAVIVLGTLGQAAITYQTILLETDAIFDFQMQQMAAALHSSSGTIVVGAMNESSEEEDFSFVVNVSNNRGRLLFANAAVRFPADLPIGFSNVVVDAERYRVYTHAGPATRVQVAQEVGSRSEIASGLALRSLWPMLALFAAILLSVLAVTDQVLKPLDGLRQQIMRRRPGDLGPLSPTGQPAEIHPLITEMNALMARMQETYEAQHRFVSDAAHELRSPLAALQLQGETLRRAVSQEQREAAFLRQRDGIVRATRLVDQLLVLARQGAGPSNEPDPPPSISRIVHQIVAELEATAQMKHIDIDVEVGQVHGLGIRADLLHSIIRNLIDNALKYTPEGGRIGIHATVEAGRLRFRVEDSGPGIPVEERARVLDPFYRIPGSASFGSGLGLSIVDRALRSVGANLELDESERLGGLSAAFYLPV